MYCLRAVIATEQVLSELVGIIEDAHDAGLHTGICGDRRHCR